jgi:hypothetical protein
MASRMVASGQKRGLAAARKSAISLALAYQRAFASLKAAVSPALASCRSSTAIVMWSCPAIRAHLAGCPACLEEATSLLILAAAGRGQDPGSARHRLIGETGLGSG